MKSEVQSAAEPDSALDIVAELQKYVKRMHVVDRKTGLDVKLSSAAWHSMGQACALMFVVKMPHVIDGPHEIYTNAQLRFTPDREHADLELLAVRHHSIDVTTNPKATAREIITLCVRELQESYARQLSEINTTQAAAEPRTPDAWRTLNLLIEPEDVLVMRRVRLFVSQKRLVPVFRSVASVTRYQGGYTNWPGRKHESFSLIFYDRTKIPKYAALLQAVAKKLGARPELLKALDPVQLAQHHVSNQTVQPGSAMWKYLEQYGFVPRTATAAAESPERVAGTWRGYCVTFDDGLTFPTETGCKGTCAVQYEPSTGKVYHYGPNGFQHHGETIGDWAGTTRLPVSAAPVPPGMSFGIRNGYDCRFCDGTKLTLPTGIRGTSAIYRDPATGDVYESGSNGWYKLNISTPVTASAEPQDDTSPLVNLFERLCAAIMKKGDKQPVNTGRKIGRLPLMVEVDILLKRPHLIFYVNRGSERVTFYTEPRVIDARFVLRQESWRRSPYMKTGGPAPHVTPSTITETLLDAAEQELRGMRKKTATAAAEPSKQLTLVEMLKTVTDNLLKQPRTVVVGGRKVYLRAGHTGIGGDYPWLILQQADAQTSTRMYVEPVRKDRPNSDLEVHFRDSNTEPDETITQAKSSEDLMRIILARYARYLRTLDPVQAAAEPQTSTPGNEFAKVWMKFYPDERKLTVDGISVSVEATDAEPTGIEITMPDHEIFFAQENLRDRKIRICVVGRSDRGPFPVVDPTTPAHVMLPKILSICVADWKKHQKAEAAAEPETLGPRKYLRKLYVAADARDALTLPHGITVKARRNQGYCIEASLLGYSYCVVSDFLGKSGSEEHVIVEDVTPLSVRRGKIVATISSARDSADFIRQVVNAVLAHTPGNHAAREANAAAEPGVARGGNLAAALLNLIHRVALHVKCSRESTDKIKSLQEKFEAHTGVSSPRFVVVMEFPGHNSGEGVACTYDGEYLNVWYSGSLGGDIPADLRANARNRIHVRGSTPQAIAGFVRTFYGKCLTEYHAALDRMDAELQGLNDGNNP